MEDNRMVSFSLGGMAFEYDDNKNKHNNSDYLQKARKYGHFTGYKN